MIVPDINLLVFAYNDSNPFHYDAHRWWEGLLNGEEVIGLPWVVSSGFIRLIASPSVLDPPWPPATAVALVRQWFGHQHVVPLNPGDRHLDYLEQNLAITGATGSLATDAHIAALALENGAELHTHNVQDFQRLPGVVWGNPLQ